MSERSLREERRDAWDRKYQGEHPTWRGPSEPMNGAPLGSTVLELGCGDGKTLRSLLGEGGRVIGMDFSRGALSSCRRRLPAPTSAELVLADVCALPLADGAIDLVIARHVLEHLLERDREEAAREIARVLAPSGVLEVRAFSVKDMRAGKGEELEERTWLREGIPYHYFSEGELVALFGCLSAEGVRTERTEKRFSGLALERVVIEARLRKPGL